jgi:hypothetical protein
VVVARDVRCACRISLGSVEDVVLVELVQSSCSRLSKCLDILWRLESYHRFCPRQGRPNLRRVEG